MNDKEYIRKIEQLSAECSKYRDVLQGLHDAYYAGSEGLIGYNAYLTKLGEATKTAIDTVSSTADDEQTDPDHEPDNRLCACPTCINEGWAAQSTADSDRQT